MKRVNEIVKLLWGRKTGMLSGEEERQLQEWMEKEENRRMAERVLSEEGEREALDAYRRYDVERAYARFVARVGGSPGFFPKNLPTRAANFFDVV